MQIRHTLLALGLFALSHLGAQTLAITEVMYNPPESGADSLEFIEIHNFGASPVTIDNYRLSVTGSTIADTLKGVIPAGGFYVSAVNERAFKTVYGQFPSSQWRGSGLANGGNREILLTDPSATVIVSFTFLNASPWPAISNANGPSIELCSPTADPKLGGNWNASTVDRGVVINNQELKASPFAFTAGNCGGGTAPSYSQQRIAMLRSNDADGLPRLLDSLVIISGIVVGNDIRDGSGLQFTLIDNTNDAGVAIYSGGNDFGYTVTEGDVLRIAGRVTQFNGLAQVAVDSLTQLGTETVPAPAQVSTLSEATESRLLKLTALRLVDPTQFGTDPLMSYNLDAVTATGDSVVVRIERGNNIVRPANLGIGTFSVVGIGGQFDRTKPFDDDYQIAPRNLADLTFSTGVVEVPVASVFATQRRGTCLEINLLQEVAEVIVTDVMGRRLASLQPAGDLQMNFDLGDIQVGAVYITAVLPKGERATKAMVW